jgi:membrane protein
VLVRHLRLLAAKTVSEFSADNCSQMSAAISYYVLFSLFPLLVFVVGVMGVLLQDSSLQQDLIDSILKLIPLSQDQGRNDVTEAVRGVAGVGSGALGLLGLLGMAWSGSNMFGVVRRSLNVAYDLDVHRPFVRQKLLDLTMTLAFAPFFLSSLAATAFLRIARQASADVPVAGSLSQKLGFGWDLSSLMIPIVLSFIAFSFLYWFVPNARIRLRDVWPGALLAALLFEAVKVGFGVYLENFSNYDVVFGSLGAVVAFLFWVYLSASILLLGAEVASEYPRVMRGDYDQVTEDRPSRPLLTTVANLFHGLLFHRKEQADSSEGREA